MSYDVIEMIYKDTIRKKNMQQRKLNYVNELVQLFTT